MLYEVITDHRAAHHVAVPAEVLGRRVDDEVGAEVEGALEVGGREGVVDAYERPGIERVRPIADCLEIVKPQERIGRCFNPDQAP